MDRVFRFLCSVPGGGLVGLVVISVLTILILQEDSIQPFKQHLRAAEIISAPLVEESVLTQELIIPVGLAEERFQTGILFGSKEEASIGSVEISLTQGSHSQTHVAVGLAPRPREGKRFNFNGFSEGLAVMTIKGMAGNTQLAPSVIGIEKGEGAELQGLSNEDPLYLSVDWFKFVDGGNKLSLSFPNRLVALIWLLPFAGLIALSWAGMRNA